MARLTTENARLRLEVARLARALEVKAGQAPGVVAVAPVVAEDASGLYRRLVLGLGSQDGLRPGMPVTAPRASWAWWWRWRRTAPWCAPSWIRKAGWGSGWGRSRAGAWPGAPPGASRGRVSPTVAVAPGDLLLTGATLGLFPDGIPVGRVERVERAQGGLKVRAWARPLVDLSLLEEVVVLRPL